MKILIAGQAKTGTTALLYLVASSLGDGVKLLFEPLECPSDVEMFGGDLVAKVIIRKDVNLHSFVNFDKKIIIIRDPRDRLISSLLYSQYHAKYLQNDELVSLVRECLEMKESAPASVSIREILEVIGKASQNLLIAKQFNKHFELELMLLDNYLASVPDAFLYRYEDFVDESYTLLETYLGRPICGKAVVPGNLRRVVRTKKSGDWRNWFTADDVQEYQPVLGPWLKKYGYDAEDWKLNAEPIIDSRHCSKYFMLLVDESPVRKHSGKSQYVLATNGKEINGNLEKTQINKSLGYLDLINEGICSGWAFYTEKPTIASKVQIFVNDRLVLTTEARLPRPDVKECGIHPTGLCGFRVEWPIGMRPQAGDQVEAWVEGDVNPLLGSPKQMSAPQGKLAWPWSSAVGAQLVGRRSGLKRTPLGKSKAVKPLISADHHPKLRAKSNQQNGLSDFSVSSVSDSGNRLSLKKNVPLLSTRINVSELIKKVDLGLLGLSEKEAAHLIREALALLGRHIIALDDGVVKVQGLGSFQIGFTMKEKDGLKVPKKHIVFRAIKPRNKQQKRISA